MSELIYKTEIYKIDSAIEAAIERIRALPIGAELLSVYLSGSYANGYAVPTSDVDLNLIFLRKPSKAELTALEEIESEVEKSDGVSLDLVPYGLKEIKAEGVVDMPQTYRHLWGEGIHAQISGPLLEDYTYRSMHAAYFFMGRTRKENPYRWPLWAPDPSDPYLGYAWQTLMVDGEEVSSLKEIVVLSGWIASALIAWRGKKFVATKAECVPLFQEVIGGDLALGFSELLDLCREKLHYHLPEERADYSRLADLLPVVGELENLFLEEYQYFLIWNLGNKDPVRRNTSIIRLGEILYPNGLTLSALQAVVPANVEQALVLGSSVEALLRG